MSSTPATAPASPDMEAMNVKQLFTVRSHPPEDVLEEYVFKRLDENQTAAVEEHLLLCEACRDELTELDSFVLLMKSAAAEVESLPKQQSFKELWRGIWDSFTQRPLTWAVIPAAACLALVLYIRLDLNVAGPAVPVALISLRGGSDTQIHAPSRKPLDLRISDIDLANAPAYRIEVVDLTGKRIWEGQPARSDRTLSSILPKGLPGGIYWVRLYNLQELIQEYALRLD